MVFEVIYKLIQSNLWILHKTLSKDSPFRLYWNLSRNDLLAGVTIILSVADQAKTQALKKTRSSVSTNSNGEFEAQQKFSQQD